MTVAELESFILMNNNYTPLTRLEIYNNAAALQTLLHALCKSVSQTD
jgi:hypothetical protein